MILTFQLKDTDQLIELKMCSNCLLFARSTPPWKRNTHKTKSERIQNDNTKKMEAKSK
jgi:hypothetical protein